MVYVFSWMLFSYLLDGIYCKLRRVNRPFRCHGGRAFAIFIVLDTTQKIKLTIFATT